MTLNAAWREKLQAMSFIELSAMIHNKPSLRLVELQRQYRYGVARLKQTDAHGELMSSEAYLHLEFTAVLDLLDTLEIKLDDLQKEDVNHDP